MKRIFFGFLLVVLVSCDSAERHNPYSFFVAGHVYGNPATARNDRGLYKPFNREIDSIVRWPGMKLGILTGDMVFDPTAERYDSLMRDLSRLRMPVYSAPGNHDVMESSVEFNKRFQGVPHVFRQEGDIFLLLNVNVSEWNVPVKQIEIIRTVLKDSLPFNNLFIFLHQIVWWEKDPTSAFHNPVTRPNSLGGRGDMLNFWPEIMPLLKTAAKPVYVFAGDAGAWCMGNSVSWHSEENVTLITSGMGCPRNSNYLIADVDELGKVKFHLRALQGGVDSLGRLEDHKW